METKISILAKLVLYPQDVMAFTIEAIKGSYLLGTERVQGNFGTIETHPTSAAGWGHRAEETCCFQENRSNNVQTQTWLLVGNETAYLAHTRALPSKVY